MTPPLHFAAIAAALMLAPTVQAEVIAQPETGVAVDDYPWLPSMAPLPPMVPLSAHFPAPDGLKRVTVESGSFAHWLRGLPIRTDRANVLAYDGRPLFRPSAAVVVLDVGKRDLQQCADTAIRLHAEYLWHTGKAGKAAYHFTSGDRSTYADWRRGERFRIKGSKVDRVAGRARGHSRASWMSWLTNIFRYAGTQSLRRDARPIGDRPFEAGDVMVHPGGPGHAVVVLDIATDADGRQFALIGQGFMPAEDLHVVKMAGAVDGLWFPLPADGASAVQTPSWPQPFGRAQAIRFRMP